VQLRERCGFYDYYGRDTQNGYFAVNVTVKLHAQSIPYCTQKQAKLCDHTAALSALASSSMTIGVLNSVYCSEDSTSLGGVFLHDSLGAGILHSRISYITHDGADPYIYWKMLDPAGFSQQEQQRLG